MTNIPEIALAQKRFQLENCESKIQAGLGAVAKNLATIKSQELWVLDGYKSFEDYCQRRWKWGKSQAYNMISAAKVVANIEQNSTIVEKPERESQTRELAKASPEQQPAAWQRAREIDGNPQPSARACAAAVQEVTTGRKVSEGVAALADSLAAASPAGDSYQEDEADERPQPDPEPEDEDEPGIRTATEELEQAQLQINIEVEMWRCFMQAYNIADKARNFKLLAEYSNKMATMATKRLKGVE